MTVTAAQIYQARYEECRRVLALLKTPEAALTAVRSLLAEHADLDDPEAVQATFFLKAFEKRLTADESVSENLYLLPDQGRQIEMFNFMAQRFPVVRYAQDCVNEAFYRALQGQVEGLIWDIGIGNGQQMARLLTQAVSEGTSLHAVTIIGLDPAENSLKQAEDTLTETCDRLGLSLTFVGLPKALEQLTEADWRMVENLVTPYQGRWLVNASFALHHVAPVSLRDDLFQRLRVWIPALICLIEPDANFLEPTLSRRFDHAWQHYGLSFWAIDQIEAPAEHRNLLKQVFFGREILDVIGQDVDRVEQFETGAMWTARLREAGFACRLPNGFPASIPGFPAIGVQACGIFLALTAQGQPIISIAMAEAG